MRELGWEEGKNIRYLPRAGRNDPAQADVAIREFVDARVAVIVTTGPLELLAAHKATKTIPVVGLHPSDPVDLGVAASLARPGGNVTGDTQRAPGIGGKRLDLIAETQASAKRFVFGRGTSVDPLLVVEAGEAARCAV